ncbi:MAG TPA: caspase family protein [Trinickia sp.]|uniref:caspase family protein n=1 Tax=Trinickia sp. TaxID=2571163 RepID=UPI002CAF2AE1|nr:caspase family protein [Trinickia sp.]HVW50248.1 caspase family protein [Trinickia sp.]
MISFCKRISLVVGALLLSACAASSLPGYQNAYQAYNVPQSLVDRITVKFREHGLDHASVKRDSTGRVQLDGSYRNDDEVDTAFIIVQSIVGLKSTSPFYPQNILHKRWEIAAGKALEANLHSSAPRSAIPVKRALVVGLNHFGDPYNMKDIQGRDDAVVVQDYLRRAGYKVTTLLDEQATKAHIEGALRALEDSIGPNDDVFIFISSHGTPPVPTPGGADRRKMSILAFDSGDRHTMAMKDAAEFYLYVQRHSVPDTLVQEVAKRPSRMTRIVIDTCYSGDMLDDVQDESTSYILKTNGGKKEVAGVSLASWTTPDFTSKGIHLVADATSGSADSQHANGAPVDRKRNGYTIITATSPNEESLGPPKGQTFKNPAGVGQLYGSYFTQSLFAYLNTSDGHLDTAFRQAKVFTSEAAIEASKGAAHQIPREFSTVPNGTNVIN